MSLARKIFGFLEGKWSMSRSILNVGKLTGLAVFERSLNNSNELFYKENGVFEFYDSLKCFEASREYIYRLKNEEDIFVFFKERDELFHKFDIGNMSYCAENVQYSFSAVHLCQCDVYNVTYEFKLDSENPEFCIVYDVKGPNKSYISKTNFKKIFS